jgi:hypothetical protein
VKLEYRGLALDLTYIPAPPPSRRELCVRNDPDEGYELYINSARIVDADEYDSEREPLEWARDHEDEIVAEIEGR